MARFAKVLGPQTAAALGTIPGTQGKKIIIKVVTSAAETVAVSGSVDGTTQTTGSIMFYNVATGALHSSVNMDDGTFYLPECFTHDLTFTGSGAADTKTVTVVIFD